MCSARSTRALPRVGYPIQKSPDHRLLPTPRRLSQVAASFFGSWYLGIHLGPLLACSTYNHSSITEEITGHVTTYSNIKIRKRIQLIAYGILEISIDLFGCQCAGGDERIRTADPLLAKQVLSQLSYIPWGTAPNRAISGALCASLRMRSSRLRGRLSDLESLKSGKDKTKPWVRLLVHSNERNATDFHRELSRLPQVNALSRVRDGYSSRSQSIANLLQPNDACCLRTLT